MGFVKLDDLKAAASLPDVEKDSDEVCHSNWSDNDWSIVV
jgi:hypothetical protein